jgi:diguanylate cyclase (GGDEF)-like protein
MPETVLRSRVPSQGLSRELSPDSRDAIRQTLAGRILWCPLIPPVDKLFAQRRQEEFALLARAGWPLLALMVLIISGVGWLMFGELLTGTDGLLWWYGLALESVTLAVVIRLVLLPSLLPHYQRMIIWGGAINLAIPLLGTMLFHSPVLAQATSYIALLIINIQILALRLSLLAAGLCVLNGIALALLAGLWLGGTPDLVMMTWLIASSLIVTLFISAILERQERISFLQGLLLEYESRERARLNDELERMAHQDALSGLANRRHFDLVLDREWDRLRREEQLLAVLFIDVDHFKLFNDTYGHAAGDECLAAIGRVLAAAARRPGDVAARYGGEEFVVLLPATDVDGAREVAERILAGIDALLIPHAASSVAGHVTVSIGLAVRLPQLHLGPSDLLAEADQALYAAKHAGRHRMMIAQTPAMLATSLQGPLGTN